VVREPALLITLNIRAQDLGDVFQLIQENEIGEEFVDSLEPDVREEFPEMVRELGGSPR
jgi:hypothetical protein